MQEDPPQPHPSRIDGRTLSFVRRKSSSIASAKDFDDDGEPSDFGLVGCWFICNKKARTLPIIPQDKWCNIEEVLSVRKIKMKKAPWRIKTAAATILVLLQLWIRHHQAEGFATMKNVDHSLSVQDENRRDIVSHIFVGTSAAVAPWIFQPSQAAATAAPPPPMETMGGGYASSTTIEGIGGGFDVREISTKMKQTSDVLYPSSIVGVWDVKRLVTNVEGDVEQAKIGWSALAGNKPTGGFKDVEKFQTRYLPNSTGGATTTILDRGFELASRSSPDSCTNIQWDSVILSCTDSKGKTLELAVVDRQIELPAEEGFGFNELIRITTSGALPRVVRVKRRYRRAYDESGKNRVIEGLEIMKTYRVLDGIAGIEMPTSTTKTQIRMTRPS